MKIGDLVRYGSRFGEIKHQDGAIGTVLDFPVVSHPKEFQKVRVLTENGIQSWIMQFCEVVNENN